MSSGDPTPPSGAPYIIICSGRINAAIASNANGKIGAASQSANELTSFMQGFYKKFDPADCRTLSYLQHKLMDHVAGATHLTDDQIEEKIVRMFSEMDALEDKYAER